MLNRRRALLGAVSSLGVAGCAGLGEIAAGRETTGEKQARVVVVGGGFGGATLARTLKVAAPGVSVTLVEPQRRYTACPFSNLVIGTDRSISEQVFDYTAVARVGVRVIHARAQGVDAEVRKVQLEDGQTLSYDRLVLAPGIDFDWGALPGFDEAAAQIMPHAWRAGDQTRLLRDQIRAMPDGGVVGIVAPANPYRCPPGPYERASLIAHYLKTSKPKSKVLILDSKDRFSKQRLFLAGWRELYGDMVEWRGLSDGASVVEVDARTGRLITDFDSVEVDVGNVIPPQQAGRIARDAGAADASGWCPIDAQTFASRLLPDVYVLGDAAVANAMPKSAFAANTQAKYCAIQLLRSLRGMEPLSSTLANTCYSLLNPDYGVSVVGVYRPTDDGWKPVTGAGGVSAMDATAEVRQLEAGYARSWYTTLTRQVFGP